MSMTALYWILSWLLECYSNFVPVCAWLRWSSLLISTSSSGTQRDPVSMSPVLKPSHKIPDWKFVEFCGHCLRFVHCFLVLLALPQMWATLKHNDVYFLISWCCMLRTLVRSYRCAFLTSVLYCSIGVCCHHFDKGICHFWHWWFLSVFNFDFFIGGSIIAARQFCLFHKVW